MANFYFQLLFNQLSEIKNTEKIPKLIKVLLKQSREKKCHKKFYSESKKKFWIKILLVYTTPWLFSQDFFGHGN